MTKHIQRKSNRNPKETARLRADRERYLREKPSPEQLLAEGGNAEFLPLGELIFLHQLMGQLKKVREGQGLTLADLANRTGVDQAALSRLERGANGNPTLDTLYRIALALNKEIVCSLQDVPTEASRPLART